MGHLHIVSLPSISKPVPLCQLLKSTQRKQSHTSMATYNITITDSAGSFTPLVRNGGTPASGGTVLLGGGSDLASTFVTTQVGAAIELAKLIAENDRAAGN